MPFYKLRFLVLVLCIACFNRVTSQIVIADALPGCLNVETIIGIGCDGNGNITNPTAIQVVGNQIVATGSDGAACCSQGGDGNSYFEFEWLCLLHEKE